MPMPFMEPLTDAENMTWLIVGVLICVLAFAINCAG
jgi:hypothetical protein